MVCPIAGGVHGVGHRAPIVLVCAAVLCGEGSAVWGQSFQLSLLLPASQHRACFLLSLVCREWSASLSVGLQQGIELEAGWELCGSARGMHAHGTGEILEQTCCGTPG